MQDTLTDYLGQTHEPAPGARVLSLVPSLTELVFDLDCAVNLVGRTHYCIHPAERVDAIPSVGGTKKIKMDRVRELAPTHALLNVDENPKDMADDLRNMGIDVVVTHPQNPDDNIALYRLIGGLLDAADAADALEARFKAAREALSTAETYPRRNVLYLIWKDPWMGITADTYIGRMLGLVNWQAVTPGADPALEGDAARYPEVRINDATLSDIDLVLFSSEPYAFTDVDIEEFNKAVPAHAGKAHIIDGEMTSWYGSRAVAGLEYMRTFAAELGA